MTAHEQKPLPPPKKAPVHLVRHRQVQQAAQAIAAVIGADKNVREELRRLLVAVRRLPSNVRGRSGAQSGGLLDATVRSLHHVLRVILETVLPHVVADIHEYHAGIRRFFLEPHDTYTLDELAALWQISREDVDEILGHKLATWATDHPDDPDALRITWADALRTSLSYNFFRPIDVERALGADFGRVRPESWRTVPLLIHVPRFMVETLDFDGVMSPSGRTPAARVEQYLFDLFPGEHRMAFVEALNDEGQTP
ncbi:MAG TPA: hypothetical protein VKB93_03755 [Thermoanaerobaculia bacterium]|nr:hypothetical protein [Thermoanaerobaculia bacterium]